MAQSPDLRGLDQILGVLDNGQYLPQVLDASDKLIAEISDFSQAYGTKASGSLTLTIKYSTDRFGQVEVEAQHSVKEPKPPKSKATVWRSDNGGLTIANPNQRSMEIREVNGRRELRSPTIDD